MGLRERLGGMAEAALNDAIDDLNIDKLLDEQLEKLKEVVKKEINQALIEKVKANIIDKIDGQDDIPDV